ncbi:hypothetical protein Tco_0133414 [Tanacetum coccineum]
MRESHYDFRPVPIRKRTLKSDPENLDLIIDKGCGDVEIIKWAIEGLGISSLYALNRALMFKWVWRFLSQNSSLWANVIKSIYGDHGKIGKHVKVSYPSIWLDIVKEVDLLKKRGLNLLSFVNKKVGNGSDTLFWEETWHGDAAFKFLFSRAYALESCKNIDVASKLSQNSLAFTFRLEPRGGVEQDQFDSLKAMLEGDFIVASIRKLIDEFTLSEISSSTRWIKAVPIKVNVLAWKIKLDNLPTRLNISRRGMDIDSIICLHAVKRWNQLDTSSSLAKLLEISFI